MNARLFPYLIPLRAPWRTSRGTVRSRRGVLVKRRWGDTDGWGDACPQPGTSSGALRRLHRDLATAGSKRREPPTPEARHAWLEASWDARARRAGVPLAHLLADELRTTPARFVRVNAVLPRAPQAATVRAAHDAVEAGHDCVKLKVEATAADARRVRAVRRDLGGAVVLRLDLNGGQVPTSLAFARQVADCGIAYIEDPVSATTASAWAEFQRRSPVPTAADEAASRPGLAAALVRRRAVDALVVKPMRVGGLDRALRLVAAARRARIPTVVTDALESAVGRAGALHLAAALGPGAPACGFAGSQWVARDVAPFPRLRRGALRVPKGPGLGVLPKEATL